MRNVKARYRMLVDEEMFDDLDLADMWGQDASNRRLGITTPEDRAKALGLDLAALAAFDAKVADLDRGVWKKAAAFYRGLLASGIFRRPVICHEGVYLPRVQAICSWSEIEAEFGVSRSTITRRARAGADITDLLKPARPKAPALLIEHAGLAYSIMEFATAFKLSRAHVQRLAAAGLSGEAILQAPRPRRGRPASSGIAPIERLRQNTEAESRDVSSKSLIFQQERASTPGGI
jgi:hypothetical protein